MNFLLLCGWLKWAFKVWLRWILRVALCSWLTWMLCHSLMIQKKASKRDVYQVFAERVRNHKEMESRWAILQETRVEYFRGKDFVSFMKNHPELKEILESDTNLEAEDIANVLLRKNLLVRCDRVNRTVRPGRKRLSTWPGHLEIFAVSMLVRQNVIWWLWFWNLPAVTGVACNIDIGILIMLLIVDAGSGVLWQWCLFCMDICKKEPIMANTSHHLFACFDAGNLLIPSVPTSVQVTNSIFLCWSPSTHSELASGWVMPWHKLDY